MILPTKAVCPYCSKLFFPDKLRIHLRYFCGPDAMKTSGQQKQERKRTSNNTSSAGASLETDESEAEDNDDDDDDDFKPKKTNTKKNTNTKKVAVSKVKKQWTDSQDDEASEEEILPKKKVTTSVSTSRSLISTKTAPSPVKNVSTIGGKRGIQSKKSPKTSAKKRKINSDDDDDGDDSSFAPDDTQSDSIVTVSDSDESDVPIIRKRSTGVSRARSLSAPPKPTNALSEPQELKLGPISVLHQVRWRRVICDEAHALKNKRSATAKSVCLLTTERRWCLSGTPLQNRVGEMFSLLRFLRYSPYSSYFCKNCPCSALDYQLSSNGRLCEICGHSPLRHYHWLMRNILNPIKMYGYHGPGRDAMVTLRKEVLDGVLLRRTKAGRASDLSLPSRVIIVRNDLELDTYEKDFYAALYTQTAAKFKHFDSSGTILSNFAHLFELLLRLRQAVNHPYLVLYGNNDKDENSLTETASGSFESNGITDICGICREPAEDAVITGCRHTFCRMCIRGYLEGIGGNALDKLKDATSPDDALAIGDVDEDLDDDEDDDDLDDNDGKKANRKSKAKSRSSSSKGKTSTSSKKSSKSVTSSSNQVEEVAPTICPTCFAQLTVDLTAANINAATSASVRRKSILSRVPADRVGSSFRSSTKIEALLEDIWASQRAEPGLKAIVFSQFVSMLELVQHRLTRAGIRCVRLDGGMSVAARDRAIDAFRDDPYVTIILISLKAGGQALNLTAASRVYLMDCWCMYLS
jgi:DNA repair protein RAD16